MGKWGQRWKGGKARAGYQAESQRGDFGSVLPGIPGNGVVTCQSCFNQEQRLTSACVSHWLKLPPSTSSTTY